ncbi:acyl-CoA N-acyltransferase [Chytriomyces sp. MP71]|nr:acyl-CoA N-acyltransferase [Chytriomyces sp. MP71]
MLLRQLTKAFAHSPLRNPAKQPPTTKSSLKVQAEDAVLNGRPMQPGASSSNLSHNEKEEQVRTFHPEFTYPLFGDEENLFGYKDPVVRLHYSAGSLFSFLGMSYTYRIDKDPEALAKAKKIGDATPKADDVLAIVRAKLPEKGVTDDYSTFMEQVRRDEQGAFSPMGDKVHEYTVKGKQGVVYEIYKANFATPRFKSYNAALQVFCLFFIEGASAIDAEDEAWECYLLFERRPLVAGSEARYAAQFAWALCGFSTVYTFWCWPDQKRMRISQVLVFPPYQKMGHGKQLYHTVKKEFLSRKEIADFGVEDPNDDFQILRDICDLQDLLDDVEKIRKAKTTAAPPSLSSLHLPVLAAGRVVDMETRAAVNSVVEQVKNGEYKLSKGQAARCIEILLLKFLDSRDKKACQEYRLLVKKRLYQRNEEVLSGMEVTEMQGKLQETFESVEQGYRDILKHLL